MKTAVAASPNDDERRRFLSALQALLHKRVSGEALMFGVYTRFMSGEREREKRRRE